MNAEIIRAALYEHPPRRIAHIEGVLECALSLAHRHFPALCDDDVAAAAYLHDYTKEYSADAQREIFTRYAVTLDENEELTPKLWHAKSAWALGKFTFHLPEAVCDAVLWHTTAKPDMTPLEKVIYFADYIEKNRTDAGCVEVRENYLRLAEREPAYALEDSILFSLNTTVSFLMRENALIHPDTLRARNYLVRKGYHPDGKHDT